MKTKHLLLVLMLFASTTIFAQGFWTTTPIGVTGNYYLTDDGTPGVYGYQVRILCDGVPATQWYGPYTGITNSIQPINFTVTESLWIPDPLTKGYFTLEIYMQKVGGSRDDGTTYCTGQFMVLPNTLTGQTTILLSVN